MKSTISKINFLLLGCFLSVAIANAQGPSAIDNNAKQTGTETKTTNEKFTGHWFIKSGEDFFLVRSGNLPPGLVKKTTDNEVEDIDVEGVKRAVNFRRESKINGKPVDSYYFVIEKDGEDHTAFSSPAAINGNKEGTNSFAEINQEVVNTTTVKSTKSQETTDGSYNLTELKCDGYNPLICAIMVCYGATVNNWTAHNPCGNTGGSSNVCLAFQPGLQTANANKNYYYVLCGQN